IPSRRIVALPWSTATNLARRPQVGPRSGIEKRQRGPPGVGWPALLRAQAYASPVSTDRPKHLVHILAREFASNLATPTLIVDAQGLLIFYNEAAEEILGRSFAERGEMSIDEFSASVAPRV